MKSRKGVVTHRKKVTKKSSISKMNEEIVLKIKELLAAGNLFQHQIAAALNINQGRVSEVKNGYWDRLSNL